LECAGPAALSSGVHFLQRWQLMVRAFTQQSGAGAPHSRTLTRNRRSLVIPRGFGAMTQMETIVSVPIREISGQKSVVRIRMLAVAREVD